MASRAQKQVRQFTRTFGLNLADCPSVPAPEELLLRCRLVSEELGELLAASTQRDIVNIADSLADLLYVVYGTAESCGLDMTPIFDEVHRSNMTKTKSVDSGGKVIKPDSYSPPDLLPIIEAQIRRWEALNNGRG